MSAQVAFTLCGRLTPRPSQAGTWRHSWLGGSTPTATVTPALGAGGGLTQRGKWSSLVRAVTSCPAEGQSAEGGAQGATGQEGT